MNIKHILAMAGCTAVGVAVGWYSAKTYYDKIHKQDIEDLKHDLKEFYEVNGENAHLDHTEPSESDSKADIKRIIPHDEEKDRFLSNFCTKLSLKFGTSLVQNGQVWYKMLKSHVNLAPICTKLRLNVPNFGTNFSHFYRKLVFSTPVNVLEIYHNITNH